jgi:diguanylate cyclase (GGDEF)-like protein
MVDAALNLEQSDVLEAFRPYESFCKSMLDAYVVVDHSGKILKSNPLFSVLSGRKSKQVLKAGSFDELIELSIQGKALSISHILLNKNPTRFDEVTGKSSVSPDLNLIIGTYPFVDENTDEILGAFILIRDVTAESALQDKYKHTALKSITDQLTGLFSRSYFEDYLEKQIQVAHQLPESAEQRNFTIALIDIDFFKKVNDEHGHQAGDAALQTLADIMSKTFRKTDILCRYGGEEFLVVLPTTNLQGAITAVEKLRAVVDHEKFMHDNKELTVTISCGVAQVLISNNESYEQTIARADEALYFSKHSGRNLVSIHDGGSIKALPRSK